MVRAILAGTKTQTRRVIRRHDTIKFFDCGDARDAEIAFISNGHSGAGWYLWCSEYPDEGSWFLGRMYRPGDTLWVREAWRTHERPEDGLDGIIYRADNAFVAIEPTREAADNWVVANDNGKHGDHWRPSIFMPRWASRLSLLIGSVRVQRLQDISEDDARAEGVIVSREDWNDGGPDIHRRTFARLWDSINGRRAPWASNQFVWAIEFRHTETVQAEKKSAS